MLYSIIIIMAAAVICALVGLNFTVEYEKKKAKIIAFIFGAFLLPVVLGSIAALVLIEKDMEMSRFLVGCLLISGTAIGHVYACIHFADKAEAK